MTKNILKYILIIVAIVVITTIFILAYAFNSQSKDIVSTQEKIKQEIEYLDDKIISVANSLNNLDTEYLLTKNDIKINLSSTNNEEDNKNSNDELASGDSKNSGKPSQNDREYITQTTITTINPKSVLTRNREDIDWQYVNTALEEINNSWPIITIDLKSINVSNDELISFSNNIDTTLKYTKINDKTNSLISLANLYSSIPSYENSYSRGTMSIELRYAKSDIISSYALLNTERWSEILAFLNDADSRISKVISSSNDNPNIQKIYIELKEYIKSVNDMDLDLCYMKYYYLMKDLEHLD